MGKERRSYLALNSLRCTWSDVCFFVFSCIGQEIQVIDFKFGLDNDQGRESVNSLVEELQRAGPFK